MPIPPDGVEKNQVCQLHRWTHRENLGKDEDTLNKFLIPVGAHKSVIYCEIPKVELYLHCWKIFHTCEAIENQISTVL